MGRATLVIMAAGIGSRYGGGVKQLAPVGPNGEIIMDYSVYDAVQAGFDKVVFVIRRSLEDEFKEVIGKRIEKVVEVEYAYQEIEDIPNLYQKLSDTRTKPWGTGQAILCCKDFIKEPFMVINADDFYGRQSFEIGYKYLIEQTKSPDKMPIGLIGFILGNTLSDHGGVTRGICKVGVENCLIDIVETKNIVKTRKGATVLSGDGETPVDTSSVVSMNMWGFPPRIFTVLEERFEKFLKEMDETELGKKEFLLPTIVGELLQEELVEVSVLLSNERWFGLTYKEDREKVVDAVRSLVNEGVYPYKLY